MTTTDTETRPTIDAPAGGLADALDALGTLDPVPDDPEPNREASVAQRARRALGGKSKSSRHNDDDQGKNDAATPGKSSKSGKSSRTHSANGSPKSLQRELASFLSSVGVAMSAIDPFDGAVILDNAETTARRLDDLAKDNPRIRRALEMLTAGTTGAGVVFALAPIVIPIAHNHGLLPTNPMIDSFVDGMVSDGIAPLRRERRRPDTDTQPEANDATPDSDTVPGAGIPRSHV